jgi:hypothetical protein
MTSSILLDGVLTWHPNSLCLRESPSSIVAKLAIANRVSPKEAGAALSELRVGDSVGLDARLQHWTIRATGAEVTRLATLLGENADVVGTATLSDLPLPSRWHCVQMHLTTDYGKRSSRRICPDCVCEGYASVFHHVQWLHKCFIHGTDLVTVDQPLAKPLTFLPYDTTLAEYLYDEWSSTINRTSWWGIDVSERPFCTQVNEACEDMVRRWKVLCGAKNHFGLTFAGSRPLSLVEAELLVGIDDGTANSAGMDFREGVTARLISATIDLTAADVRVIEADPEAFEFSLEHAIHRAWAECRGELPVGHGRPSAPTLFAKGKLAEGHACFGVEPGYFEIYGCKSCIGLRRSAIWHRRAELTDYLFWIGTMAPPPYSIPVALVPFVRSIAESLEWGWGQAAFSDAMRHWLQTEITPDGAKEIGSRWLPRFSIQAEDGRLALRMLTYDKFPLPKNRHLAQESAKCDALMQELWSRVNARRRFIWDQSAGSDRGG